MTDEVKAPTTSEVDEKAKKQAEIEAELAELEKVDIALPSSSLNRVMARERYNYVVSYQSLAVRCSSLEASARINEKMGNKKASDQYSDQLTAVKADMNFFLRSIQTIDKKYPDAKAEMLKGILADEASAKK